MVSTMKLLIFATFAINSLKKNPAKLCSCNIFLRYVDCQSNSLNLQGSILLHYMCANIPTVKVRQPQSIKTILLRCVIQTLKRGSL